MPTDYTLERTHGRQTVFIHAADLYLLKEWQDDPNTSDELQRSAIFSKWLEIGSRGRMPYVERLEGMNKNDDDLTDAEKDLLARVRNSSDRRDVSYSRIVRTFYGEDSDPIFARFVAEAEYDEPVFDNAMLYNAGSNDGLQSLHGILTRLPQIIEGTAGLTRYFNNRKKSALEEVDANNLDYAIEISHRAARWDHVFIYDKEANDSGGDVLLVYVDDRGRAIRYSRVDGPDDFRDADAMLCSGQDCEHRWWMGSDYGDHWAPSELARRWLEFEPERQQD